MLTLLAVRNVVLIKTLDLEFQSGLTVLTGETGAGKSILLDALGLALGSRANFGLIGAESPTAEVTAIFTPEEQHPIWHMLDENGIEAEGEIIMRRRLRDGKSTALINDTPVSLNIMRQVGDLLIEIQGQFEGRGLLDQATHRQLLDQFASHDHLCADCADHWDNWILAKKAYETALASRKESEDNAAWLKEAVTELDHLAPEADEESRLMEERDLLSNITRIAESLHTAEALIDGEDGAINQIAQAGRAITRITDVAGHLTTDLDQALQRTEAELSEVKHALAVAQANLEGDPKRIELVDDRLYALRQLARKHGIDADQLHQKRDQLHQQLAELEDSGGDLTTLAATMTEAERRYHQARDALSQSRYAAANRLDAMIMAELPPLKLEQAEFRTSITPLPKQQYQRHGGDAIRFEASTNPGMNLAPIDQIASGGELARFLLALKVVLADTNAPVTLIFDEVDAGVGGAVANAVGTRLARLGEQMQSIVITHSPQVAARGHHHYQISKSVAGQGTISTTAILDQDERINEVSRMLAGETITSEARAAAIRLLEG